MNLLKLVQKTAERLGLDRPGAIVASQEVLFLQLKGLLEEVIEECSVLGQWSEARVEAVWTLTASANQGSLQSLFPQGFAGIIPDTFYNRSTVLKMTGPLSAQEWQNRLSLPSTGVPYAWTTIGGDLFLHPAPAGGETAALEYWSSWLIRSSSGVRQEEFLDDTDVCDIPDQVLIAGLRWKWAQANGLPWESEAVAWNRLAVTALARKRPSQAINLADGSKPLIAPAVVLPTSNWTI